MVPLHFSIWSITGIMIFWWFHHSTSSVFILKPQFQVSQKTGIQLILSCGPHWHQFLPTRASISNIRLNIKCWIERKWDLSLIFSKSKNLSCLSKLNIYLYREHKQCPRAILRFLGGRMWPTGRTLSRHDLMTFLICD